VTGGFFGDAVTADLSGEADPGGGGVVVGALLGGLGGLVVGLALRNNRWMTDDDIVVIDSFAGMGLLGSLSLGALMKPAHAEAYSVNAVIGTAGGAVVGGLVAHRHDLSARRMARVDVWAAAGALTPWLIFAAAGGDRDDAQVAGFFSLAGLVGGAWIGLRTTRGWDERPTPGLADAPPAMIRRDSDGAWSLGAPALRPAQDSRLGPVLGTSAAVGILGGRF
jgi:hypothetical protein